jgi:hypothetical protein
MNNYDDDNEQHPSEIVDSAFSFLDQTSNDIADGTYERIIRHHLHGGVWPFFAKCAAYFLWFYGLLAIDYALLDNDPGDVLWRMFGSAMAAGMIFLGIKSNADKELYYAAKAVVACKARMKQMETKIKELQTKPLQNHRN